MKRRSTDERHQHHGDPDHIEDVNAEQIRPRRPAPGDQIFLQTEEYAEAKHLGAASQQRASDFSRRQTFPKEFVRDECE